MKKLLFILPLLYYSCTDDIVADIDALQTENAEQDAQIDSLLTVITTQQEYIDSMNNVQNAYIDYLISESMVSDSLLQVYTDSLNTVQNTLNTDQQAYIDSLHNAQQTTLEALANSALNAGFTPTQVYSGTVTCDYLWGSNAMCENSWQDLDLSAIVGSKSTLVILAVNATFSNLYSINHFWRTNDGTDEDNINNFSYDIAQATIQNSYNISYILTLTDSEGIVEWKTSYNTDSAPIVLTVSVAFYLNQ